MASSATSAVSGNAEYTEIAKDIKDAEDIENAKIAEDIEDAEDIENAKIAVNAEDIENAEIVSISQILDMYVKSGFGFAHHCSRI